MNPRYRPCLAALVFGLSPHLAPAAPVSPFLVADQGTDSILLARDLNGDGDTNDAGEVTTYFDAANAAGLGSVSGNVFTLTQTRDRSVLIGDGDTDAVYRLRDADDDGSAQGAGEASLWFSGTANAAGFRLNTPNGIAEGPDGAIYIVEADTAGSPTGDWVYRTQDLNGDGDANDAGEATRWLNLTALNAASSPFEIRFEGNTAYVMDTAGATPNRIYAVTDADGNGTVDAAEVRVFAEDSAAFGARFDFAMDVGLGSVWTWEWLADAGIASMFRFTDLDGSGVIDAADEVAEVWNTTLLGPGYSFLAGFSMALDEATGEFLLTSNGSVPGSDWIVRLLDLDGDGAFWGTGESGVVLSRLDQGSLPDRPRSVAFYTVAPVPLPATLPMMALGLAGLAALRRRRRG